MNDRMNTRQGKRREFLKAAMATLAYGGFGGQALAMQNASETGIPTRPLGRSRAHKVLERDVLVYRRNWTIIISGFFEPIFYLLGIGFGLGTLVGDVGGISYAAFVAPGLMATAAMNGAMGNCGLTGSVQGPGLRVLE